MPAVGAGDDPGARDETRVDITRKSEVNFRAAVV